MLGDKDIESVQFGDQTLKRMTILFSDIRSFTALSEKMNPEQNFRFINSYLSRMGPIVRDNGGFIDKFIGDGIMALFPKNADDALNASVEMLRTLSEYNFIRINRGDFPVDVGIGLNTGDMMLGTVGEHDRMEGTVIGDTVNLAARMEDLTKTYGVSLLISEATYKELEDVSRHAIRIIDRLKVRGREAEVLIYEVFDAEPDQVFEGKLNTKEPFEAGCDEFYRGRFQRAYKLFKECETMNPLDRAVGTYLSRCRNAMQGAASA